MDFQNLSRVEQHHNYVPKLTSVPIGETESKEDASLIPAQLEKPGSIAQALAA